jgi:hypothetical protein
LLAEMVALTSVVSESCTIYPNSKLMPKALIRNMLFNSIGLPLYFEINEPG